MNNLWIVQLPLQLIILSDEVFIAHGSNISRSASSVDIAICHRTHNRITGLLLSIFIY